MKNLHLQKYQKGFSLIELMIVMTVTLLVMIAAFSLMQGSIITANVNYHLTDANQRLRNAQEYINRDLLVAGDGIKGTANIWVPTAFATRHLSQRTTAELDPSATGYTNLGMILSDDNIPASTEVFDSPSTTFIKTRSDRITLISVDKAFTPISLPAWWTDYTTGTIWIPGGDVSIFDVGEIYYLSDGNSGIFGTVTGKNAGAGNIIWDESDSYKLNRVGPTGNVATATGYSSKPSTLMRVQIIQYFVDTEGRLIRRVFGLKGAGHSDAVIAENLTDLQFRYILQPTTNGTNIYDQPISQVGMDDRNLVRLVEP